MNLGSGYRILIAVGLLFLSTIARADTLLKVGGPVTGTTLTIQDSALTALNSGWANGVTAYIDPYHGTLNGQSVTLFCIDPNHLDNASSNGYSVNVSVNGAGPNTLQAINAGTTSASQLYGALAWLSQQLAGTSNSLLQQEYQAAIWQLGDYTGTFTVVSAPKGFDSAAVTTFEQMAKDNALTSGFSVLTDANEVANGRNAAQEYIILTPEPSTALLSVSGIFGLFMLRRRKSAESRA